MIGIFSWIPIQAKKINKKYKRFELRAFYQNPQHYIKALNVDNNFEAKSAMQLCFLGNTQPTPTTMSTGTWDILCTIFRYMGFDIMLRFSNQVYTMWALLLWSLLHIFEHTTSESVWKIIGTHAFFVRRL